MVLKRKVDVVLEELDGLREQSRQGGGPARIDAQHAKGKLTARERIDLLFDDGTFEELDAFVQHRASEFGMGDRRYLGDAVVTGYGKIDGRICFAYSQDFTVIGGTLSEVVAQKICKVMDLASASGAPIVGLIDSGGARIQEGIDSLAGYSAIFQRNVRYSGVVPQISAMLGPAAGGAVYSPALTDFIMMVRGIGQLYITGPDVVKAATGEVVSHDELGGAEAHATKSGVCQFVWESEHQCIDEIRRLLGFLPQNNMEEPPRRSAQDDPNRQDRALLHAVPDNPNQPYDMMDILLQVIDDGDFMEVHRMYARNIIVGFARFDGRPSASSPSNPTTSQACSTSTHPRRPLDSYGSATPSTFLSLPSSTCRAICRAPSKSTAASSSTAPSSSMRMRRRPCRRSACSFARHTAGHISQ